jgi:hypothetical protein
MFPFLSFDTSCIFSKTCLILTKSFLILPLWFSPLRTHPVARILYPLCDKINIILGDYVFLDLFMGLGLLVRPPCMYDWSFGWPCLLQSSCQHGVFCVVVSLFLVLPVLGHCPSFLSMHPSLGRFPSSIALSFDWDSLAALVSWSWCCPPTDVLDDLACTYFPFGMSLVITGIF